MKERKIDALMAQSLSDLIRTANNMKIQKGDTVTVFQNNNGTYILVYYSNYEQD